MLWRERDGGGPTISKIHTHGSSFKWGPTHWLWVEFIFVMLIYWFQVDANRRKVFYMTETSRSIQKHQLKDKHLYHESEKLTKFKTCFPNVCPYLYSSKKENYKYAYVHDINAGY